MLIMVVVIMVMIMIMTITIIITQYICTPTEFDSLKLIRILFLNVYHAPQYSTIQQPSICYSASHRKKESPKDGALIQKVIYH